MADPTLAPDPAQPARWGAAATVVWAAVALAVFFAAQIGFVMVFVAATMGHLPPQALEKELLKVQTNGDVLAVATFLSAPATVLALFVIVKIKRAANITDTLGLHVPAPGVLVRWLVATLLFIAAMDAFTWLIGKPIVPEFMQLVYRSAEQKGVLWFALIVAAPLAEELLFRGFVVSGLAPSRIGPVGAVIVAALAWAAIHVQYDLYGIGTIVALGLLFGAARIKTGTVVVPMAMHALANLVATIETMIHVG